MDQPPCASWSKEETCAWLRKTGFEDDVGRFEEHDIDGWCLVRLTERMIERLFPDWRRELKFMVKLDELKRQRPPPSVPEPSSECPAVTSPTLASPKRGWPAEYILPEFPPVIQSALDRKDVTIKGSERNMLRNGLIQILFNDITKYTWYPTQKHYKTVMSTLVAKYPFLQDTDSARFPGPSYATLLESLRNKMKKERRHTKNPLYSNKEMQSARAKYGRAGSGRKRTANDEPPQPVKAKKRILFQKKEEQDSKDTQSIQVHIKQMNMEFQKMKPDWSIIQDQAKQTADKREQDMKSLPFAKILELYPWIAAPVMVLHEVKERFGVDLYQQLEVNLPPLVAGILNLGHKEPWLVAALEEDIKEPAKTGLELNAALYIVPTLFKEPTSLMAVCNEEPGQNTPTVKFSSSSEANVLSAESFTVMMDGSHIVQSTTNTDVVTALTCLFATFFLYDIPYPKKLYNTLIFLEQFVFCMPGKTNAPTTVKQVANSLKTM